MVSLNFHVNTKLQAEVQRIANSLIDDFTGASRKATPQARAQSEGMLALAQATQTGGQAQKDFADWLEKEFAPKMERLKVLMGGEVSAEMLAYGEQQTELKNRAAEITAELDKLTRHKGARLFHSAIIR